MPAPSDSIKRVHQSSPGAGGSVSVCNSPITRDVTPPTAIPNTSASATDSPNIAPNTRLFRREPWARMSRATSHSPPAMRQIMNERTPRPGHEQVLEDHVGAVADRARAGGEQHREGLIEREQRQRKQQAVARRAARLPVGGGRREGRQSGVGHRSQTIYRRRFPG